MSRALGLDVGGSAIKVTVLAGDEVVDSERVPLPPGPVLPAVTDIARRLADRHAAGSLGVGLAGLVTHPAGEFVWGPHLPDRAVRYRRALADAVGFDVAVDNDANLAAVAEHTLGVGQDVSTLAVVTLGSGIGVGIVSGGRVFRGSAFAGELGHMSVVPEGPRCSCGLSGCWETQVSGARLDELARLSVASDPTGAVARAAAGEEPAGPHLVAAAEAGDAVAAAAVGTVGEWLGRGLATLTLAFDPDVIVLGGAAGGAGPTLWEPARRALAACVPGAGFRPVPRMVPSRFGGFGGAIGAALVGRRVHNGVHDW